MESLKSKKERAKQIVTILNKVLGKSETELLYWNDPFKLLIAVALSAQTTDKSVNKVTPLLWDFYPDIYRLANASLEKIEQILRPLGFYKNKSKNTINCAKMIVENYSGQVPQDINELQKLPGVGRKTANIVLNVAFNIVEGIAVDTHVFRVTHRLMLSDAPNPAKTEPDLLTIFEKKYWKNLNHQLVLFGRYTCTSRNPNCTHCPISLLCPSANI